MINYAIYILENDLFEKVWSSVSLSFLRMTAFQKSSAALCTQEIHHLLSCALITNYKPIAKQNGDKAEHK